MTWCCCCDLNCADADLVLSVDGVVVDGPWELLNKLDQVLFDDHGLFDADVVVSTGFCRCSSSAAGFSGILCCPSLFSTWVG